MANYYANYMSPLGMIHLLSDGTYLTGLLFEEDKVNLNDYQYKSDLEVFSVTSEALNVYFSNKPILVMPKIKSCGTLFQEEVWQLIEHIPFGRVVTYGELAQMIAKKRNIKRMSAQAVGQALHKNPICILRPCHRVIGVGNHLVGFGGGLHLKRELLRLEGHDIDKYID